MRKLSTAALFLLILFLIETTRSSLARNSTVACIETERQALLQFKQSLTNSSGRLSTWRSNNCCKWGGIHCDGITGHVVKLDLRGDTNIPMLKAREVNSCLLKLKHLNYLDLSWNDFQGSQIPKFFGSMQRLRYLNLSGAYFSGLVPHHLRNLSCLRVLDLNGGFALTVDDLIWVSGLSSLQHIDMSGVNLTQAAHNLMKVLNILPSILDIRLSRCGLDNVHLSHAYVNSTLSNVQFLDLSNNSFEGEFPNLPRNMTSLRVLDLSSNYFNSSIPPFLGNFKSLVHVYLHDNEFKHIEGGISRILWNLCDLKSLDLSWNQFQGEMWGTYGNLSGCIRYDLETLDLHGNFEFSGHLPEWPGLLKHLKYLDLSSNLFYGPIPASLGRLTELKELDLSGNHLNGTVPTFIGQLSNLEILDLSFNSLEGVVSEAHFANLSMLERLSISSNLLTLKVRTDWIPPFQLKYIRMRSCKISSQFLPWLQTQKEVAQLDLFNASISGTLPKWLRDMQSLFQIDISHNLISGQVSDQVSNFPSNLSDIDLSDNLISGPLPQNIGHMVPTVYGLLLAGNLINGSIPKSLCKIKTLGALDLSKNMLSGNLPHCWRELQDLNVIKLASNRLSGVIPSSIGHLSSLEWLHLNNNSLKGELPLALRNCTRLTVLDLGENGFSGNIPEWIGENLTHLQVLRLHKNMFHGSIPSQLCLLPLLQIMDLAHNDLTGTIPRCFDSLGSMVKSTIYSADNLWDEENMMQVMKGRELQYTTTLVLVVNMDLSSNNLVGKIPQELTVLSGLLGLNLSHNHLTGSIPKKIGDMMSLESLDFSSNHLSGTIPQSMSALTSLSHLNLSYNNFSGRIPTGSQLQTLVDPSIYVGNNALCGDPLPKKCPGDESSQAPTPTSYEEEEDDEGDESEKMWFYIVIMSGFATGFWGVVGVLLFKKSWRHAYFKFVDATKDRILVAIEVRVARLKMKRNHVH